MIKRLIVKNLNGKHDFDLTFHPDINIFIGKNGAGKTTLMKLIWALVSGNIEILFADKIYFDYLKVEDIEGYCELIVDKIANKVQYTAFPDDKGEKYTEMLKLNPHKYNIEGVIELQMNIHSLFFPTFRRIEGGFGLNTHTEIAIELQHTLSSVSIINKFMNDIHKFITFVSTHDIVEILSREYANIAKK
jgi:energy-coupling factor transporter ATP-binding protein EcfA2